MFQNLVQNANARYIRFRTPPKLGVGVANYVEQNR